MSKQPPKSRLAPSEQAENKKTSKLDVLRHSTSHVLAAAVLEMFPEAKFAIGPAIDDGFYYDFELPRTLIPEDLPLLEEKMKAIIAANHPFEKKMMSFEDAIKHFEKAKQPYKVELINDIAKEQKKKKPALRSSAKRNEGRVMVYKSGPFVDLCSGPHLESTGEIKPDAMKLTKISGAYWRGDEKREQLQRIYGTAFKTKKELKQYLFMLEEAQKRDHRKIGKELDLFSFHNEGRGFAFWHPKGMDLRDALMKPYDKLLNKAGYQTLSTPIMLSEEMWHKSGHWDHYKDNMYFTKIDDEVYAIKPMNCPGTIIIYNTHLHSYREFPLKYAEKGEVHRHEPSGTLSGLFRVRAFRQDDAHIFARDDQIEKEIKDVITLILEFYKFFNFSDVHIELSTRPEKFLGSSKMWDKSEKALERALKNLKLEYKINEGDGAFYGPKIDFHIKDSLGRSWQCGTVQLDFSMPERYNLEYIDKGGEAKRPAMIHRTIMGSIQRFVGILIEHYAGAFPVWLSPVQAVILPISKKYAKYARSVHDQLKENDIRVELDDADESLGKRIANATKQKTPYILVVGEKEEKDDAVAVREREGKKQNVMKVANFIERVKKEIEEKA